MAGNGVDRTYPMHPASAGKMVSANVSLFLHQPKFVRKIKMEIPYHGTSQEWCREPAICMQCSACLCLGFKGWEVRKDVKEAG